MAIELKNKITFTKGTTIYGHTGLDSDGTPTGAGNGTIGELLELENEDLKSAFSFNVDNTNNRKYILKLFGIEVANFTVPVDKFIKSVNYDETAQKLIFVFYKADETEETVCVDISTLVDIYTAGKGLFLSDNQFSLKVKNDETVLKVGEDGAYTDMSDYDTSSEIDSKLDGKANSSHTHTKSDIIDFPDSSISLGDDTMKVYSELNNEVNFGGTHGSSEIYFGYRARDSKDIPTKFVFGGSKGTATIQAGTVNVGTDSKVIIGQDSESGYINIYNVDQGSNAIHWHIDVYGNVLRFIRNGSTEICKMTEAGVYGAVFN